MADGRFKPGYDPRRNTRGGRTGVPHKATIEHRRQADEAEKAREKAIDADKTMPLEYMLRRMRNPDLDPAERFIAATRAAPYVHPQLQAIAHQHLGPDGSPIAPVISVTIERPAPEAERPRLTHEGPKETDKVQ
jgi:hypothetical protein